MRFATTGAVKGGETLCRQAPGNTLTAWNALRTRVNAPTTAPRHHQLKGTLATAPHRGVSMAQWQYEVTGAGRIWYLVDLERRTL